MFRHVVMFRWADSATDEVRRATREGLATLPDRVPGVRSFRFGDDAGLAEGNFDVAVVADFDDVAAYQAYATHPAHVELVTDLLRPHITDRAAVQHELD